MLEPLLNSLNCGAVHLQNDEELKSAISRILTMLFRYLQSDNNINLRINNTFKVFAHVLSLPHVRIRQLKKPVPSTKKKKKRFVSRKAEYGHSNENTKPCFWKFDPCRNGFFFNLCLIISIICGLLQNSFFISNGQDKRFSQIQFLHSKNPYKSKKAKALLEKELENFKLALNIPNLEGPCQLSILPKVCETFHCQVFLFIGEGLSTTLQCMIPSKYNDALQPIFLYQTLESFNHIVFIKHIKSFFKNNISFCFYCQKTFKNVYYKHRCLRENNCFACRRVFASEKTFLHSKNKNNFCTGKLTTTTNLTCHICNVTLLNNHCKQGHKLLCFSKGYFGFKCQFCKKFTYGNSKSTSAILASKHICGKKVCSYCNSSYNPIRDIPHLCTLKQEKPSKKWPRLAFLHIEFLYENMPRENWTPNVFLLYYEDVSKRGTIYRQSFSYLNFFNKFDSEIVLEENYDKIGFQNLEKKTQKLSHNYIATLLKKHETSIFNDFLLFLCDKVFSNLSILIEDVDSLKMVFISLL